MSKSSAKRTRGKIGPLKDDIGNVIIEPRAQAEHMNRYYATVFTRNQDELPEMDDITEEKIQDIEITEERVKEVIYACTRRDTTYISVLLPQAYKAGCNVSMHKT